MSRISRRQILAATAGVSGYAAAGKLAGDAGLIPPDSAGVYGPGETLTYAAQRLLTRHSQAREFSKSQIFAKPFQNGPVMKDEAYQRMQANGFADWQLSINGMVAKPGAVSLAELRAQPSRSQITEVGCEEGWTYIAEWTGVPLSHVLRMAGADLSKSKYVAYFSLEKGWWDSIDLEEALHPQTIVAHSMNGAALPPGFGGPLRMRVPRQLGYKSVKYLARITVTDSLKAFGKGLGSAGPEDGYSWYGGI